ncbi:MAG: GldG family protein [Acidobacteriota bacterium]|nr:GldG family protein [Acidobacteriota bacterium]MDQ7088550.1 GldG family protein [Acidobacteriota bacterium]
MSVRKWSAGGRVAIALLAAATLLGLANYFAHKYYTEWDWTGSGFYSLSDQSRRLLGSLEADVRMVSFLTDAGQAGGDALGEIQAVLERIAAANPARITFEQIDPWRDPMRARTLLQEFGIDPRTGDQLDVVVVESGDRRRHVRLDEMVELEPGSFGGPTAVKSLTAEGAIVAAVSAVTRNHRPMIRFATGHQERSIDEPREHGLSTLVEALRQKDMDVEPWEALGRQSVPEGTDLLVIAGPAQPWLEAETRAVEQYLESGGRVLLLLDPVPVPGDSSRLAASGLEALLERWGLEARADVVLDPPRTPAFMGPETFVAEQVGAHPITDPMAGQMVLVSIARSLAPAGDGQSSPLPVTLLESSPQSWGETTLGSTRPAAYDDADHRGPLPLAMAVERRDGGDEPAPAATTDGDEAADDTTTDDEPPASPPGRLVVTGDVDLATNLLIDNTSNRAFLLNAVSWLIDEERSLGIPPKDRQLTRLLLTPEQSQALSLVVIIGLPLLAVLMGLGIWWQRRGS